MKSYKLWFLVGGNWEAQEPVQAKNRRKAALSIREKGYKDGTWKLRAS